MLIRINKTLCLERKKIIEKQFRISNENVMRFIK